MAKGAVIEVPVHEMRVGDLIVTKKNRLGNLAQATEEVKSIKPSRRRNWIVVNDSKVYDPVGKFESVIQLPEETG